jgi:hypothetical protein
MPPPRCSDWSALLEEGERLHAHLLEHFDQMIGEEMNYFDIHYTSQGTSCHYECLNERYLDEIKQAIRPWILNEYASGHLLERDQWKPFRNPCDYTEMYYGYRTLFVYNEDVYFQLTIRDVLVDQPDGTLGWHITFEAALYGWKEEGKEALAPSRHRVADGNRMPDREWERK